MRLWDWKRLRRLGKRAGEKWGQASGVGAGEKHREDCCMEMQSARERSCCEFGRVETSHKRAFCGAVYQSAQEP